MEWISVKDRLPDLEKYENILTFQKLIHVKTLKKIPHISLDPCEILFIVDGNLYVDFQEEEITHWMPLPKPPRKKEKKE